MHLSAQRAGWLETFDAVGAQMLEPACGACANCAPGASIDASPVTNSAIQRNIPGRILSFDELRAAHPING